MRCGQLEAFANAVASKCAEATERKEAVHALQQSFQELHPAIGPAAVLQKESPGLPSYVDAEAAVNNPGVGQYELSQGIADELAKKNRHQETNIRPPLTSKGGLSKKQERVSLVV